MKRRLETAYLRAFRDDISCAISCAILFKMPVLESILFEFRANDKTPQTRIDKGKTGNPA